jgi:hypothetical protein
VVGGTVVGGTVLGGTVVRAAADLAGLGLLAVYLGSPALFSLVAAGREA